MEDQEDDAKRLGLKNVIRLGYVSLLTDVSTEMILGILPIFVIVQLGASAGVLGLIEGSAEVCNNLFRVFSGIITDKIGKRKPLVLLGYGLSSFAKPLFAVATSWGQAFIVRVIDRAGKGTRTSPRDALISDSIEKSQAGKAFGIHESLDQIGAVLGPIMAFAAIPFIAFRGIFWLSFIPALGSLIILLFFVKDSHRTRNKTQSVFANAKKVLNREFTLLLVALSVFAVGAYNFSFILLDAHTLGVQENYIPLVYALLNLASVILAIPAGLLADRIGKMHVLLIAYIVFLITSAAGSFLTGDWTYAILMAVLFGSYLGISDPVQRAIIPDFTSPEFKGTAYAIYYLTIGACSFISNAAFGLLWTVIGSTAAFQYSIVTSTLGFIALVVFIAARHKLIQHTETVSG